MRNNLAKKSTIWLPIIGYAIVFISILWMIVDIFRATVIINDAGLFAELSRVVTRPDLTLYVDLWDNKPPALFYFVAPFVMLFSNTSIAINLASLALLAVFSTSTTLFARHISTTKLTIITASLLSSFYAAVIIFTRSIETTLLMATFGTVSLLLAMVGRGRRQWMIISGICFVLGVLSKQPLALEFPLILLGAFLYHRENSHPLWSVFYVCLGCLIAGITFILWGLYNGNLLLMGEYIIWGNWDYASGSSGYTPYWNYVFRETVPIMLPLLLLALPVLLHLWRCKENRHLAWIFIVWIITAFMGAALGKALKITYFIQMMPPLIILIAIGASQLYQSRRIIFSILSALVPIVMLISIQSYVRAFNEFNATSHTLNSPILEAAEYITNHTEENDCIWLWGYVNNISYYSGRKSCTSVPYDAMVSHAGAFNVERYRPQYISDLFKNKPAYQINTSPWSYFPMLQRFAHRYRRERIKELAYPIFRIDMSSWHERTVHFEDIFTLIGIDDFQDTDVVCKGENLRYATTWRVENPPEQYYQMFVQLRDPETNTSFSSLDIPPAKDYPTQDWNQSGEIVLGDTFELSVPADIPAGDYYIALGFYDTQTLERLNIWDEQNQVIGSEMQLTQLKVLDKCEASSQ